MKKSVLLAMVLVIVYAFVGLQPILAEPFAPRVEVPGKLLKGKNASLDALMAKNSPIPEKTEVPVPAYPGAKVLFANPVSEMTVNGEKMKSMARVVLGTTDAIPAVVSWYKEQLSDWKNQNFYGMDYFWKSGAFQPMSQEAMTTPHLFVREQFESAPSNVMPEAKSIVEIYYYPPSQ